MPTRLCCCSVNPNAVYVVVGNKIDLDDVEKRPHGSREERITLDEVKQLLANVHFTKDSTAAGDRKFVDLESASSLPPLFIETSAKSGVNAQEVFELAAREACVRLLADPVPPDQFRMKSHEYHDRDESAGCQC